ncbi:MAG: hypothetical protein WD226_02625 [Planctomycetota bacterium]
MPNPNDVRASLAPLDDRQQKIVAGLFTVMIQNPTRVRDDEWVAEQLTHLALIAGEFEADSPADGVEAVERYLGAHSVRLLTASLLLFQRVGLDLAPVAKDGFTAEDAVRRALEYFPAAPVTAERDLGEQPIAQRMAELALVPADLVRASTEQLTHKMVARAMKGRRLTANVMGKVQRAFDAATGSTSERHELFTYDPSPRPPTTPA